MNTVTSPRSLRFLHVTRWSARALSALLLAFWGVFILGHLLGDAGQATRPLNWTDYFLLTAMGAWLMGLAVGWKWELVGGVISLVALSPILVEGVIEHRIPAVPFLLVALVASLFLLSNWLSRRSRSLSD
jgi:hypothetical protein